MERSPYLVPAFVSLALLCAASASAQEQHLKKADLPAAVQKTADEQSKGATVRGYSSETEDGALEYEVSMTIKGHSRDVSIAPDGSVLEVEEEVSLDALPAFVREGLLKQAGSGKITKVESLTKKGTLVAYEAQVRTGDKRSEIQVGPDGKPLEHKE
jgi:glucose/arabinose dehydrogenase